MRHLVLGLIVLTACGAHPSGAVVDDAWIARLPDGRLAADVDVTAASSTGSDIGEHCVSIHYFPPGADLTFTYPAPAYYGVSDSVYECFPGGLRDGATRRVHLVSTRTDIPVGAVARAQVLASGRFDTKDVTAP